MYILHAIKKIRRRTALLTRDRISVHVCVCVWVGGCVCVCVCVYCSNTAPRVQHIPKEWNKLCEETIEKVNNAAPPPLPASVPI